MISRSRRLSLASALDAREALGTCSSAKDLATCSLSSIWLRPLSRSDSGPAITQCLPCASAAEHRTFGAYGEPAHGGTRPPHLRRDRRLEPRPGGGERVARP